MNKTLNYKQPPEWGKHKGVWTAWPYLENEWPYITESQNEFIAFCQVIANFGEEQLNIAFPSVEVYETVSGRFGTIEFIAHIMDYGDSWFRDTAPIFVRSAAGKPVSICFQFNGWGNKYVMPGDEKVALTIAKKVGFPAIEIPLVFEGGSMEVNGFGTGMTTLQCLLNKNRNPGKTKEEIEQIVMNAYGLEKLIWIDEGLKNDHTDGHIDNIARFVEPGKVVVMRPSGSDDPNASVYKRIIKTLENELDAQGNNLQVVQIPSPGRIVIDGEIVPASYLNFCITNGAIIVPVYGSKYDEEAVEKIGACFPDRKTVGISSRFMLTGGGSYHCVTQQEPLF